MKPSLVSRLEDIPGVASVVVDLEGFGRGIDVRLTPDADEVAVMEQLHALLAAYGVRHERLSPLPVERSNGPAEIGVAVRITPITRGARVEVETPTVRSFRVVAATPLSIAQGLADAWCQVIGRIPIEIVDVGVEGDVLIVTASDGEQQTEAAASISQGWARGLTRAIAGALGVLPPRRSSRKAG
jgi:hypothetical protein